jgi:DNA-binding NarL/FixJ family response regulator
MIKIVLVDDHSIFRESLKRLLIAEKIADVVAEAKNGIEFLKIIDSIIPDLVLMDIAMPGMDGIEAAKKGIEKMPNLKIIALSMYGDEKYYFKMIESGVKGFVLKNVDIKDLENAITEVASGGSWFSNELLRKIIVTMSKCKLSERLTNREIEVLKLICNGLSSEQIAKELNLSYDTIKWHRSNILSKTGCKNTASLIMHSIRTSLVELK